MISMHFTEEYWDFGGEAVTICGHVQSKDIVISYRYDIYGFFFAGAFDIYGRHMLKITPQNGFKQGMCTVDT